MGPLTILAAVLTLAVTSAAGWAQTQEEAASPPVQAQPSASASAPAYGPPISFEAAQRAMAAAEVEATKLNAPVVITILDSGGRVVMLHRLDGVQHASIRIAEGKARTALDFRRSTRDLEEAVARGGAGLRFLALEGVTPIEGGVPILADGKIIGAVGVSGIGLGRDGQIAQAAADAAK
jgi:glc operon protein GlcG